MKTFLNSINIYFKKNWFRQSIKRFLLILLITKYAFAALDPTKVSTEFNEQGLPIFRNDTHRTNWCLDRLKPSKLVIFNQTGVSVQLSYTIQQKGRAYNEIPEIITAFSNHNIRECLDLDDNGTLIFSDDLLQEVTNASHTQSYLSVFQTANISIQAGANYEFSMPTGWLREVKIDQNYGINFEMGTARITIANSPERIRPLFELYSQEYLDTGKKTFRNKTPYEFHDWNSLGVNERSFKSHEKFLLRFYEAYGLTMNDVVEKRKRLIQRSKNIFQGATLETSSSSSVSMMPKIIHKFWMTSNTKPSPIPLEMLRHYLAQVKSNPSFQHVLWVYNKEKIAHMVRECPEITNYITIRSLDEIWPNFKGKDLFVRLLEKKQYAACSNVAQANIIHLFGGISTNFGVDFNISPSFLCNNFNIFMMRELFLLADTSFGAAPGHLVLDKTLDFFENIDKKPIESRSIDHDNTLIPWYDGILTAMFDIHIKEDDNFLPIPFSKLSLDVNQMHSRESQKAILGHRSTLSNQIPVDTVERVRGARFDSETLKQLNVYRQNFMGGGQYSTEQIAQHFLRRPYFSGQPFDEKEVIVCITSYPRRIQEVWRAIEQFSSQAVRVNLVLCEQEFPNGSLPWMLQKQINRGLEILWCDRNTKPYKKLIPALKKFPNAILITYDDDGVMPLNSVSELLRAHKKNPNCVVCGSVIKLTSNQTGTLNDWNELDFSYNVETVNREHAPSTQLLIEGCSGVLYPPGILHEDVIKEEIFMEDFSTVDDVWFTGMCLKKGNKICRAQTSGRVKFIDSASSCETALFHGNFRNGGVVMDIYLRKMAENLDLYPTLGMIPSVVNARTLQNMDTIFRKQEVFSGTIWENEQFQLSKQAKYFIYTVKNVVEQETDVHAGAAGYPIHSGADRVFLISHEPTPYREKNDQVRAAASSFSMVIHNDDALNDLPNGIRHLGTFSFGNRFGGISKIVSSEKNFSLSMLASVSYGSWSSNPYSLSNYTFCYGDRIKIFENEKRITSIPRKFYVSSRGDIPNQHKSRKMPSDNKTKELYDSQFHVAVENIKEKDYFSEKILEPLMNKVVPIYIGCPNIGDFFNIQGLLLADDAEGAIKIANSLTNTTYAAMLPFIEENYQTALRLYNENSFVSALKKKKRVETGLPNHLHLMSEYPSELLLYAYFWDRETDDSTDKLVIRKLMELEKKY